MAMEGKFKGSSPRADLSKIDLSLTRRSNLDTSLSGDPSPSGRGWREAPGEGD